MTNQYIVTETEQNERIDKLLTKLNTDASRSQIQNWFSYGYVQVNNKTVKANYKCSTGDMIEWTKPEVKTLKPEAEDIPLSIVYEDSALLIVNKPRGMVVHPAAGHDHGTLVNALLHYCDHLSSINGEQRPGIVHRIDKDTSGLLIVAKNDAAHSHLSQQLFENAIERHYETIVHGEVEHDKGSIDAPIGRDKRDRKKMGITSNGKYAKTYFQVKTRFSDFTHVLCQLETGRTHQIRLHMKYIGHPIVGDPKYGKRKTIKTYGQVLHAASLKFKHPFTDDWMDFRVPPPPYFQELLTQLSNKH